MARAKLAPRVKGPYTERGGTRFRIRVCNETGQHDMYFSSLKEAQEAKKQAERELPRQTSGRRVRDALDTYYQEQIERGACLPKTAQDQKARLRDFFGEHMDDELTRISVKRAAEIYERAVQTPTKKTGQPPSAATHRFYLNLAQTFFRWAVRKGYMKSSPFDEVRPVGRVSRGKKQLRFEEASRFISTGLQMFDTRNDTMALASVTALLLGCRAGEVLHARVRDLDCNGTKLWIAPRDGEYRGKTHNASRSPDVPEVLQPRLRRLMAGKLPEDYLFGVASTGNPKSRQVLHTAVRRICVKAGVPVVCPHSLRGLWATAGVRSGALSHAVAAALGHGSFSMTERHYVEPGAMDGARTDRLVEMLDLDGTKSTASMATVSAEQLLASLPSGTLAKLIQLAHIELPPKT